MKKNVMMRVAALLMVCVLATTCGISGTFAKYASEFEGSDTARVAKWAFTFDGDAPNAQNEFAFDLFNTTTYTDANVDVDGDGTEVVIAPGTTGSFDIVLKNESEVTAKFKVALSGTAVDTLPLNFKFTINSVEENFVEFVNIPMGATVTVTVTWEWPFEAVSPNTDAKDTELGEAAGSYEVTATVTVEQVD